MREYLPILIVGAIIGVFATLFLVAYCIVKKHKEDMTDRDRKMSDKEIITRLMRYAKPYWKNFVAVFFVMLFSAASESYYEVMLNVGAALEILLQVGLLLGGYFLSTYLMKHKLNLP